MGLSSGTDRDRDHVQMAMVQRLAPMVCTTVVDTLDAHVNLLPVDACPVIKGCTDVAGSHQKPTLRHSMDRGTSVNGSRFTWASNVSTTVVHTIGASLCTMAILHMIPVTIRSRAKSHVVLPNLSPLGLLHRPLLGFPQAILIGLITPNQVPWASPSHIQSHSQNPGQNTPPQPLGCGCFPRSHDDHTPLSSPRTPTLIGSDHTQPGPMGLSQSHPNPCQNPGRNAPPQPWDVDTSQDHMVIM